MARTLVTWDRLVFVEVLWACFLFDVDALDFASFENGSDDVFCLEGLNTSCFIEYINKRLVYGLFRTALSE